MEHRVELRHKTDEDDTLAFKVLAVQELENRRVVKNLGDWIATIYCTHGESPLDIQSITTDGDISLAVIMEAINRITETHSDYDRISKLPNE
ncbi:MAG: hypothetical protein ACRBB4_05010 [Neptuniibacter sp.]